MDGDIGAMLESVLSDPKQMEQITQMAKNLMGAQPEGDGNPSEASSNISEGDRKLFSTLGKAFSRSGDKSRSTALLVAMRPYMRPEKQEKLDRAMKLAQLVRVAGTVMGEYGGFHGL